jgi:uncharacterized membrane protein YgdD (TMEM256/DUF423 family)
MDWLKDLLHAVLHLDDVLPQWAAQYGPWIYAILVLIVFCETGLVVTPFLPGDSLLFAAGAVAATAPEHLNVHFVVVLLIIATLRPLRAAAFWLMLTGIAIFSGTLYVLALTNVKWLGAITPVGGVCLLAGWLALGFGKPDSKSAT